MAACLDLFRLWTKENLLVVWLRTLEAVAVQDVLHLWTLENLLEGLFHASYEAFELVPHGPEVSLLDGLDMAS